MPLHGKIVVIKRSGGDGTEFPLTATCLFGRKPDCDIRIQLPQVSKEHCRIDLNENKEIILTNLSSVNPTRVNGEALQQSERLKHGDVITIIDRSFRFEYPPAPTPKKRSSISKTETFKVLQDQQVGDTEKGDKRISEVSTDPHLKDGTNHDNIQRSLEKTLEVESKEDSSLLQSKTTSPFNDLYQMIKKSLDVKTPRKSSASLLQTPTSRFCTPKPGSVRKNDGKPVISTEDKSTLKEDEAKVSPAAENISNGTPKSVKKQRKSFQVPSAEMAGSKAENAKPEASSPQKRNRTTPQRFSVSEVIEQISAQTPKSPGRRRSKESTPVKPAVTSPKTVNLQKASPRNSGKADKVKETSKKRKSGELAADLPTPQMKKKRVSFGGHLSPELFDKRLPPDSPLRKGAAPRRSLGLLKPKQSLLRRASVIGLLKEHPDRTPPPKKSSAKNASPKTLTSAKKSPKSRTPSPKAATPAKKSPTSRSASPKAATPAKKSPTSRSASPKAATPAKKSPTSRSASPKAATPAKKSPTSRSASPKAATPAKKSASPKATTPAKKSPASRSTSPKAATPAKKSPTSRSASPKAATPAKKSPKSNSPSPARGRSPSRNKVETPKANESVTPGVQTPTVQGRFSVSRISTPSPIAEDAVTNQVPVVTVTPKLPLRRKSISRKTPSVAKSAVKAMLRRSGISRASMKGKIPWADIVKFGQTKAQVAAPAKKMVTKKTMKKPVSKPQTPARQLKGHVSTGHADSPVTIVVGRAHKQKAVHPTGAAPRLVTNIALLKKNMKMDEDLSGVSEMFKTPVNERKRRSVISDNSTMKTPVGGLGTSVVEPSVLNTPEEPGEMMVSPLTTSSAVKDRRYNSEAVQRLLDGDQESRFASDVPAMEIHSDSSEQHSTDLKTTSVTTPKQKPELPDGLTGVKRIMKTPRQKAEPVEDLRGKLLKTPKQKPEQQECLTGVKRIMKTPRQKAEPVEDLRGRLLKTPKQKPEQQECLTGVKRIMKTPRQKAEPVEDLRGNILKTPKQKPEQQECLSGVKRLMKTPQQEAEPLEETPAHMHDSEDQMTAMKTPNVKSSPSECLTGIKRIMKTPREKTSPVEDMVGVKRLMKTPREKSKPVEENFGIKKLMKSPRLRGNAPVEDFEGLQELMEEPLTDPMGQLETNEQVEDQTPLDCGGEVAKELDFVPEEPQDDVPSDVLSAEHDNESSSAAVDENLPVEQPKVDTINDNLSEEQQKVEIATGSVTEMDTTATHPAHEKKPVRGRRAKTVESKAAEDEQEATTHSEEPVLPAPVRGRRGKKTEATAPTVRQTTRGRNAKTTESRDVEVAVEKAASPPSKVALKPKRGRNAKTPSDEQAEIVQEVVPETVMVQELESEQSAPVVDHEVNESAAPQEKAVLKPKRGRKTKQPEQAEPEQQDAPCTHSDEVPQGDMAKDANDQLEVVPCESDETKSSDAMETAPQAPVTESLPEVDTETCKVTEIDAAVQKKSVRGRRAKLVESKSAEHKDEATEPEPVVPAPVRGRRGKKNEAAAPPAVRQTTRGRNAKSQESTSDDQPEMVPEKAVEKTQVTEISTEAVTDQTSHQEEIECAPPAEEAAVKRVRGRKTKQTPAEPPQPESEKIEVTSDEQVLEKPRRGRKTKPDPVEQKEEAEDAVVTMETKQQSQPPVRAKRGRNAKQEEDTLESNGKTTSVETTKSQEPVKKLRRTRKAEQEDEKPREEEVQTVEMVVPDEVEAPLVAEPVKMNEQATVAAKPRRGRKTKQDTESESPVEANEVQAVPAVSSVDKPKRGRRGKQVTEEVAVVAEAPAEKPSCEMEAEETNAESEAPVIKPSRARGVKTSAKNEVSQAIPAKRARRGAALPLEETNTESTVLVSESAPATVEPAKRGRRAAAKPATDDATVISEQVNPAEDSDCAVVEDTKASIKSVKWKGDLEVFDIPRATPVKAVRGRKAKPVDQVDSGSKNVSKGANKTEEKDLSDTLVEAQPVKRARRGAKAADVTADEESTNKAKSVEAETLPKTRRGRSAKK